MAIKTSVASEKNQKIKRVQEEVKNLLKHKVLNEVPEIKKMIKDLLVSVNAVSFKNTDTKMIEGLISTPEEILKMIKDSSGYTKWELESSEIVEEEEINNIKENFNIDFKEKEIKSHRYTRTTKIRNSLSDIIVTVLPGLFCVNLYTDRFSYSLEGLVNNKQFEQGIATESDN